MRDIIPPVMHFVPQGDGDPLANVRAVCREVTLPYQQTLAKITAVGAVCENGGLLDWDKSYLRRSVRACAKLGVIIPSSFELTAMNLANNVAGDFLKFPRPTDILVICYVFNGYREGNEYGRYRQSDLHFYAGSWYAAAVKSEAKVITIFGKHPSEVTERQFRAPRGQDCLFSRQDIKDDPEYPRMSVLLRKNFAAQLAQAKQ